VDNFAELLVTVRKTASRVALVVHAVRHAQLIPPDMVSGRLPVSVASAALKRATLVGGSTLLQDNEKPAPWDETADVNVTPSKQEGPEPETALLPARPPQASPLVAEMQEFADRLEQHRSLVCADPRHAALAPSMPYRLSSAPPRWSLLLQAAVSCSQLRWGYGPVGLGSHQVAPRTSCVIKP